MDNKYIILDTINTNHFYCASIDDVNNGMGYDELFPTLEDAKIWVKDAEIKFIDSGIEWEDIKLEIKEFNLTNKEFDFLNGDKNAFFDNLYELPYKVIEF